MFSCNFSIQFLSITIFVICLLLHSSTGVDDRYKTCSTEFFTCGSNFSNIGYPFWGEGRPQYCGHPSLQLQCLHNETTDHVNLIIGKEEAPYNVVNMTFSHLSIIVELQAPQNISCMSFMKQYSDVFKLSSTVENTMFVYNCPKDLAPHNVRDSVSCFAAPTTYRADFMYNMTDRSRFTSCDSFEVPVFTKQLDRYETGLEQISDVIHQGFEMNYEYSSECIKCNNSGGTCGSSSESNFLCLCVGGAFANLCQKSAAPRKPRRFVIFFVSAALAVGLCMLIFMLWCFRKRRSTIKFAVFWKSKAAECPNVDAFLQIYDSFALTRHTHAHIKKMTNGFKDKLGEGGYAIVYKGKLLSGRLVAVKVLKLSKGDGEDFLNEVASISRTNHVNIVALLGFCFEGNRRALVYEYLSNGSLEKYTFHAASLPSKQSLPWETLSNIAIGIARGLDYLHRGCNARILHFDIKPHNILLDEDFCPKISDFGLARLCPLQVSTISMMEARGTIGYIAPEVFCRTIGGVSHKSDVYSFGMMVLDMVCGRNNLTADRQRSSELYFPQWIYSRLELETEAPFEGSGSREEMGVQRKMILVSLWCIQTYPSNRPPMSLVVEMLQGGLEAIEMPPNPNMSCPPRLAFDSSATLTTS